MTSPDSPDLSKHLGPEPGQDLTPEPLWQHFIIDGAAARLGALGVAAGNDPESGQRPEGMHRVGVIDFGYGITREALIGGLGESHVALPGDEANLPRSISTARMLVSQMLESTAPGTARLSTFNAHFTDAFAGYNELGPLFEAVPPSGLSKFIDRIAERHARLATYGATAGSAGEPWHINLILDKDGGMTDRELDRLNTIIAAGPQYGSLIYIGRPLPPNPHLHQGWYIDALRPDAIRYDEPPTTEAVRQSCRAIAAEARLRSDSPDLSRVVPAEMWQASSGEGLHIPLGIEIGSNQPYEISLDNQDTPHALITGRTGSGKSNVLNVLIASLTQRYGPEEVQLTLLDYKMGMEFARYAVNPYLPHAKLVGERIDQDPEFGLAALESMTKELERRGRRAQQIGATTYGELHDDPEPDNNWPQIVMVIDEFHKLLESEQGGKAAELMLGIARQGRALGVHLVLATQNVSGIDALVSKNEALFTNFALRISTAQGTMLNPLNTAADFLPRHHALVNAASGDPRKNVTLWIPDATTPARGKPAITAYQRQAYERYVRDCRARSIEPVKPRSYDSQTIPQIAVARDYLRLRRVDLSPRALLAEELSVNDRSAGFRLSRDPGKNIAVIGNGTRRLEVNRVLYAAAASLAKQQTPDQARFSIVCLDRQSATSIDNTAEALREAGHEQVTIVRPENAPKFLESTYAAIDPTAEQSHFVIIYGADSSGSIMNAPIITQHVMEIAEGQEVKVADGATLMAGVTPILSVPDGPRTSSIKAPAKGVARVFDDRVVVEEEGPSGNELLYGLLEGGPSAGVHIIASFSSAAGLRNAVTGRPGHFRPDHIGAYAAIGIQPSELNPFTPDSMRYTELGGVGRENRAMFYDRTKAPRTVRMYASPDVDEDEDDD